jgi:hypothetical protein
VRVRAPPRLEVPEFSHVPMAAAPIAPVLLMEIRPRGRLQVLGTVGPCDGQAKIVAYLEASRSDKMKSASSAKPSAQGLTP